jgi:hypothetical protein
MKLNTYDYNQKAQILNAKYPSLNCKVNVSKFGGRLEIEVCSVDKAKTLNQMFPEFCFTSGNYK